jgi:hypothetical protein
MPKLDLRRAPNKFPDVSEWLAFAEETFPGQRINIYEIIEMHKQSKRSFAIAQNAIMVAAMPDREWRKVVGHKVKKT